MPQPTEPHWQTTREKLLRWNETQIYLPNGWRAPGVVVTFRESRRQRLLRVATGILMITATVVAFLIYTCTARAEGYGKALCSPQDPDSCVYLIDRGEPAPFTGHLITYRRAAELVVAYDNCQTVAGLRVAEEQAICRAKLARSAADRESLGEAHLRQLDVLQRRLEAIEGPQPWWQKPGAIVMVAVAGMLTGVAGGIYLTR
ncbi:MAG: hypothetical protein JSU89_15735 [Myxococcales bacterium]|nr:MAG: hypothetical protein JSU89_15735 [Myxococcales bacterium]